MQHRAAALVLIVTAGCASDVDLQLGLEGNGDADSGISSSVGTLRAARVLSGPGDIRVMGVAWHPASLVVAGGDFDGVTDLGTGPVDGGEYNMGFVVAYDPANGDTVWAHAFTGSSATDASYQLTESDVMDVAVATDGTVYAAGSFGRTIDFGTGPIESTDGCHDGVVARFASDGTPLPPFILAKSPLSAVAPMPDGGLVVSGYEVTVDCPWLEGGDAPAPQRFLTRLDAAGQVRWKVVLSATGSIEKISTSSAGNVVIQGGFSGRLELGAFVLTATHWFGSDSFIALFSPDGAPQWLVGCLRDSEDSDCNHAGDVAFGSTGELVAIGTFRRRVELAGTAIETGLPESDISSTYVAELAAGGEPTITAILDQKISRAVAIREEPRDLVLAGEGESSDFQGPYVGVLADGTTLSSARAMSPFELSWGIAWDVATGPAGEIALVGAFHGDADFGNGPVHAEADAEDEGDDGFVAIYDREVVENAGR